MLIAAYAGCGKSTAARDLGPDVLDLPSMPYRWLLPPADPSLSDPELEQEKGALHRIADPRFPHNYVLEILRAEQAGKTVLFPTIVPAIDMLVERYGRDVLVVYPEEGLKEEYRQRYLERGNSRSFLSLFTEEWEERLEDIERCKGRHLRLKSGVYLLSVLPGLLKDRMDRPGPAPVPDVELERAEREIAGMGRDLVLWTWDLHGGPAACPVEDLDAPAAREILDAIGKAAYERDLYPPRLISAKALRLYHEQESGTITWHKHLSGSYQAVAAEPILDRFAGG